MRANSDLYQFAFPRYQSVEDLFAHQARKSASLIMLTGVIFFFFAMFWEIKVDHLPQFTLILCNQNKSFF